MTGACSDECDHPCGSCNESFRIVSNTIHTEVSSDAIRLSQEGSTVAPFMETGADKVLNIKKHFTVGEPLMPLGNDRRFVVSFRKERNASFYPLHSISGIFSRAFFILGIPVRYTEGFNPLPRMEFSQPLALGIESSDDIMAVWLKSGLDISDNDGFIKDFNKVLPEGLVVRDIRLGRNRGEGKKSIGSLYWGSRYEARIMSLEDFRCIEKIEWESEAPESLGFDADTRKLLITLNDAHGGDRNIVKLLSSALGAEKVMDRCMIRRLESLTLDGDHLTRVFEAL